MPTIHVELFAGRTVEQKRALAAALTEAATSPLPPLKNRFSPTADIEASRMPDSISGWMACGSHCR